MRKKITLLITLVILAGCESKTAQAPVANGLNPSAELSAGKIVADMRPQADTVDKCPSRDFELFLRSYSDNLEIQKLFTSIPLESVSIDPLAEPEPREISKIISSKDFNYPLMPSVSQQANEGLVRRLSYESKNNVEVILVKPDTDYQMSFFFKQDGCWELYRIKDYSL